MKKSLNFNLVKQWKGFWNHLLECLFVELMFVSSSFEWESVVKRSFGEV